MKTSTSSKLTTVNIYSYEFSLPDFCVLQFRKHTQIISEFIYLNHVVTYIHFKPFHSLQVSNIRYIFGILKEKRERDSLTFQCTKVHIIKQHIFCDFRLLQQHS